MEEKTKAQEQLEAVQNLNFVNRNYGNKDPAEVDLTILSQTADKMKVKMSSSNQPEAEGTAFNASTLNKLKNATQTSLEQSIEALQKSTEALNAVEQKQGTPIYENGQYVSTPWDADKKADKTELIACNEKVDKKADKTQLEDYLKKSGGQIKGKFIVDPSYDSENDLWNEGIRVNKASNGWAGIYLAGEKDSKVDATEDLWTIARRGNEGTVSGKTGDLTIECGNSIGDGLTLYKDGSNPTWKGKDMFNGILRISGEGYTPEDRYYPIAKLPVSSGGTFDSLTLDGVLGGWQSDLKLLFTATISNRDKLTYITNKSTVSQSNATDRCDISVYTKSNGEAIVYLVVKQNQYYMFDFYVHAHQSEIIYSGEYMTSPEGTHAGSLRDRNGGRVFTYEHPQNSRTLWQGDNNNSDIDLVEDFRNYDFLCIDLTWDNGTNYYSHVVPCWAICHARDMQSLTSKEGFEIINGNTYWSLKTSSTGTHWRIYAENARLKAVIGYKLY